MSSEVQCALATLAALARRNGFVMCAGTEAAAAAGESLLESAPGDDGGGNDGTLSS